MRVWRICRSVYRESSFSGLGGLSGPGRWHHKGNRVVYTSQSLSLAQLEIWVHESQFVKPIRSYISVFADIPDGIAINAIPESELPIGWRVSDPSPVVLRDLGTRWLRSLSTAVSRVPSAITPGEFNYLLNPSHPDFSRIIPGKPELFEFDPRMWKLAPAG